MTSPFDIPNLKHAESGATLEMERIPTKARLKRAPKINYFALLTILWAFYYFASWTFGQRPEFAVIVIWGGAALVGLLTLPKMVSQSSLKNFPLEGILLGLFLLWTIPGLFVAVDTVTSFRHFKIFVEAFFVMVALSVILKTTGEVKWFYFALLGVALYGVFLGGWVANVGDMSDLGVAKRIDRANGVGRFCVLGIWGILGLWGEYKQTWIRTLLVASSVPALYGVLISASRGAFIALFVVLSLWAVLCMMDSSRFKVSTLLWIGVLGFLAYLLVQFVLQETFLGTRVLRGVELEDGSSQMRLYLVTTGLSLFINNPILGAGLGQFGVESGTLLYAHNEFIEILVATGLPGIILYSSIYVVAWLRLSRSLTKLTDPMLRYRSNMARVALLLLLSFGAMSRPNLLGGNMMFLFAIAIGMSHWADKMARQAILSSNPLMTNTMGSGVPVIVEMTNNRPNPFISTGVQ